MRAKEIRKNAALTSAEHAENLATTSSKEGPEELEEARSVQKRVIPRYLPFSECPILLIDTRQGCPFPIGHSTNIWLKEEAQGRRGEARRIVGGRRAMLILLLRASHCSLKIEQGRRMTSGKWPPLLWEKEASKDAVDCRQKCKKNSTKAGEPVLGGCR